GIEPPRTGPGDGDRAARAGARHYGLRGEYESRDRDAPTVTGRLAAKWQSATAVAVPPHSVAKLGTTRVGGGKRILLCVDHGQGMRAFGVDRDPTTLVIRHIDGFVDGMKRTRRDTGAPIHAHIRTGIRPL